MGQDKAALRLGSLSLVERAVRALDPLCEEVWLASGDRPRHLELGRRCLLDEGQAHGGPLQGILSGLRCAEERHPRSALLVAACDMPLLTPAIYSRLLVRCREGADFVGWRGPDGPQPLCSVWSASLRPAVQTLLGAGEARPLAALALATRAEWLEPEPSERIQMTNINTPDDLARLRQRGSA